jgi:predicted O-methyltransferase YrrM
MKYSNPEIESSYYPNNIGETLYKLVLEVQPKVIVEFGSLNGYSAVCMAMALHELGNGGKVQCYDLWTKYPYRNSSIENTKNNISKYGLLDYVEFYEEDFNTWNTQHFDLLHVDISNDGETLLNINKRFYNQLTKGKTIIFEGGSHERDNVKWMHEYGKVPMNSVKSVVNYEVLNENFPSVSLIKI